MSLRILCSLAVAALALVPSATAQRLIQFPAASVSTPQAGVYTLSPFASEKLIPTGTDDPHIYQRNSLTPSDVSYWTIVKSGADALRIFDSQFVFKKAFPFSINAGPAAMAPDGSLFVVTAASNLNVYDAATQTQISFPSLGFGPSAADALFSYDSKRLFIFSITAQRLTAIDMVTKTVSGTLSTPGANNGALTLGANGLLYLTYENKIVEIDPTVTLGTDAVRRTITVTGKPGRLLVTPDGRRALAANTSLQSTPALLYYVNLADGSVTTTTTPAELVDTGIVFDQLILAGNNIAFGATTPAPGAPRRLYKIQLPQIPDTGTLAAPTFVGETGAATSDAFFSSKGRLETANYLGVSGEYPTSQNLYVSAQLSQLNPNVPDGIFRIQVPSNAWLDTTSLNFLVGPAFVVRPPQTANSTTPTSLIPLGTIQPAIAANGRSRPLGVRVLDANGLPVAAAPVTFLSTVNGVQFEGADATGNTLTNYDGYAFVSAIAPAVNAITTITASSPGVGNTATFNLTIGTTDGGGGGGGGGSAAGITIVGGSGQAKVERGQFNYPLVVRVADSENKPVANVDVTWKVTTAGGVVPGRLLDGELTSEGVETIKVTKTDAQGIAQNRLQADPIADNFTIDSTLTISAETAAAGKAEFKAFVYREIINQTPVSPPGAIIEFPLDTVDITGRAGELLTDAIQVRFRTGRGSALADLGVEIAPPDSTNSPTAKCDPEAAALSDASGLAKCSLRIGGVAGDSVITARFAGALGAKQFNLHVLPGLPGQITKVSGDNQSGAPNTVLTNSLVVRVADSQGTPLAGQTVNWRVSSGSATVTSSSVTSTGGLATVGVNLGSTAGPVQIVATIQGGSGASVTFTATVISPATSLQKTSGDNQSQIVGAEFGAPLIVTAFGPTNAPVNGASVVFSVVSGPVGLVGSPNGSTNAQGQASILIQAGTTTGTAVVRATSGNLPPVDFTLTVRPVETFNLTDIRNVATNAPGSNATNNPSNPGGMTPGGIYRIYARGVAPGLNGVQTANLLFGPLPKRLRNVTVQVGVNFASIFQVENINGVEAVVIQAPFEMVAGSFDSVTIRINDGSVNTVNNVPVVPVQPGILETVNANNQRFVVAQHLDGRYVTVTDPARLGEQIRAYFTGGGKFLAAPPISGDAGPAYAYTGGIAVGVNGSGTVVSSAEYTPGDVGVYSVVFRIPSVINPGDNPNTLQTGPDRPLALVLTPPGGSAVQVGSLIPIGPAQ